MSRRPHVRHLIRGPFEAAIAFAGLVTAIVFAIDPAAARTAAVGSTAQALLPAWTALYAIGGLWILVGMLWDSVQIEVSGLALFVAAVLINSVALFHVNGPRVVASAATFAAIAVAGVARAVFLVGRWRMVAKDARHAPSRR